MSNIARAPLLAKLRTLRRDWPLLTRATEHFFGRQRVKHNSRTRGSFSAYVATSRDGLSTWRTCSVSTFWRLRPGMLANIEIFDYFKLSLALPSITPAIFIAGTVFGHMIHFKNCSTWSLPMLKCKRNLIVAIAFTNFSSNARLPSDLAFDVGSPVKRGFIIGNNWRFAPKKGENEVQK